MNQPLNSYTQWELLNKFANKTTRSSTSIKTTQKTRCSEQSGSNKTGPVASQKWKKSGKKTFFWYILRQWSEVPNKNIGNKVLHHQMFVPYKSWPKKYLAKQRFENYRTDWREAPNIFGHSVCFGYNCPSLKLYTSDGHGYPDNYFIRILSDLSWISR